MKGDRKILSSFEGILVGGESGFAFVRQDADASLLVQFSSEQRTHFGCFSNQELEVIRIWIENGAPER